MNEYHRHLVHASDAEQAEALLTRWGPEGQGKLGGSAFRLSPSTAPESLTSFQIPDGQTPSRIVYASSIKPEP